MGEHVGKTCPYCKEVFTENDDIVVCSDCQMPHHRSCWEDNQGCTTFGCQGTVTQQKSVYVPVAEPVSVYQPVQSSYQPQQAPEANSYAAYQPQPTPVTTTDYQPQQTPAVSSYDAPVSKHPVKDTTVTDQDLIMLAGKNAGYYLARFRDMKALKKKAAWNWPAFLFTPYWLIYRRMYLYGAIALVLPYIIMMTQSGFLMMLLCAGYIAMGFFGNYIYLTHLEKIGKYANGLTEPQRSRYMAANSGVNTVATVITVVAYVVILSLLGA